MYVKQGIFLTHTPFPQHTHFPDNNRRVRPRGVMAENGCRILYGCLPRQCDARCCGIQIQRNDHGYTKMRLRQPCIFY